MILSEFAPAKVNLFLSVINKREDGYHNIGTMFHTISCGDNLFCEANRSGQITISYNSAQEYPPEKDLIYKAAIKLQERYQVKDGAHFYLEKNMPLGAGLGGGSSDAAAALKLLNRLWGTKAGVGELEQIGAEIGADVAFFIRGGAALAEGIGEVLTPVNSVDSRYCAILVATPKCAVPTADAYSGVVPFGDFRWRNFKNFIEGSEYLDPLDSHWDFFNHFEKTILEKYPLINSLKEKLNSFGGRSLLSGSGASVFSIFPFLEDASRAHDAVRKDCRFASVARFV